MTTTTAVAGAMTAINTLRFLAVDMVEAARSGHPGAPLAQAPLGYLLWSRYLRHSPRNPRWPNRDRFVLSCGHASALLYGLLHLSGHDLPLDELRRFRQLGSRTPGHPEWGLTPGVDTTTGPLGQGLGNAVGMALAERHLAARFNRDGFPVVDHRVWCVASDGDLMEGVASEASSLAGHLRLARLTVFYDDNRITIDGSTDLTFSEDVGRRYEAYGWHVQRVDDANDLDALATAADAAVAEDERPSLVIMRSHIGFGSPAKQDTADAHGAPLGEDEARKTKENLGWPTDETFRVPPEAYAAFADARERGEAAEDQWRELLEEYRRRHPQPAERFLASVAGELPASWEEALPSFAPEDGPMATRAASGKVLNALAGPVDLFIGGSADLAGSNKTDITADGDFSADDRASRNLRFGVREHAMGAVLNGIALGGQLIPYGGTFLIFSDYMRPSIRLAALMELGVVYVFTHDSIFVGEDGPTHQPVSQLLSLRAIPGLTVLRPADANETAEAWRVAVSRRHGPTALVLSRQGLPVLAEAVTAAAAGVPRGAYVLADAGRDRPDAVVLASGSEVAVALEARRILAAEGHGVRVVSFPSWDLFAAQPEEYRDRVLPPEVPLRLAVEAASPLGWERWVGAAGAIHGVLGFGRSAPWKDLREPFGFTGEAVAARLREMLGGG